MLFLFRKFQTTVMLFVAIIVIIAFTFFYDAGKVQNRQEDQEFFKISGKSYTQKDWDSTLRPLPLIFRMGSDYIDFYQQITSERATDSETDSSSLPQAFVYILTLLGIRRRIMKFMFQMKKSLKRLKKWISFR